MNFNPKKITVRADQLEDFYRLASDIAMLEMNDNPAFALGLAQGKATSIQLAIIAATHDQIGVKKNKEE